MIPCYLSIKLKNPPNNNKKKKSSKNCTKRITSWKCMSSVILVSIATFEDFASISSLILVFKHFLRQGLQREIRNAIIVARLSELHLVPLFMGVLLLALWTLIWHSLWEILSECLRKPASNKWLVNCLQLLNVIIN